MANKKITDLTLRSGGWDDTLQFPVDDATQTWKVTGAQIKAGLNPVTTKGDLSGATTSGAPARVAGNPTVIPHILTQTGDDTDSALPTWRPFIKPVVQRFSSTGTWNKPYAFRCSVASATVGATYTNNGITFTVLATIASKRMVIMSGNGTPTASGTLTKASGTGDSSIAFDAVTGALYHELEVTGGGGGGGVGVSGSGVGGGGGGGGGGSSESTVEPVTIGTTQAITIGAGGASAVAGGTTSIGSLLQATGGAAGDTRTGGNGARGAAGGVGSGGDFNYSGGAGGAGGTGIAAAINGAGGSGGSSKYGGGGIGQDSGNTGGSAPAYGGGGGGGGGGSGPGGPGFGGLAIIRSCWQ